MPRQVDHDERRQRIAEALWRVISTSGLEAVSLRHVATEAGVSMGQVQHYFASKDELLLFAFEMLRTRVENRLVAAYPEGAPVRTLLLHIMPLDDERRAEAHVAVAFMAYAAVKPAIAEALRADAPKFVEFVASLVREAGVPHPERHAGALMAMVDGMTAHILIGLQTPESAVAALDAHLGLLLGQ